MIRGHRKDCHGWIRPRSSECRILFSALPAHRPLEAHWQSKMVMPIPTPIFSLYHLVLKRYIAFEHCRDGGFTDLSWLMARDDMNIHECCVPILKQHTRTKRMSDLNKLPNRVFNWFCSLAYHSIPWGEENCANPDKC